jgi:hypothetical protein
MTDRVQVVALVGSVVLLLLVLELVRRRRLAEEYSALWIVSALVLIGISLRRDVLDFAAGWLGVYYPPAVLVLMLVAIISIASLSFSVILSRQQRQIDRLIEENAIMAAELRELRASERGGRGIGAVAPAEVIADAAQRGADPRPQ